MADDFAVRVSSGSSPRDGSAYVVPHAWTDAGVAVEAPGTGAHLLHVAVAVCVLNDVWREAAALGVPLTGVAVTARGGFDEQWASTGVAYVVDLDGTTDPDAVAALLARVDEVAEIPRALRAGLQVVRRG